MFSPFLVFSALALTLLVSLLSLSKRTRRFEAACYIVSGLLGFYLSVGLGRVELFYSISPATGFSTQIAALALGVYGIVVGTARLMH